MTGADLAQTAPKSALVIGGGIVGLTTAYKLARDGLKVTVLDEGAVERRASSATGGIIGGSSVIPWANESLWKRVPGMLLDRKKPLFMGFPLPKGLLNFLTHSKKSSRPSAFQSSSAGLANLGLKGRGAWEQLLIDLPDAASLFQFEGCLFLYQQEADKEADAIDVKIRRSHGMEIEDLNEDEVRKLLPEMPSPINGAACVSAAGHVTDPVGLQNNLMKAIKALGGKFIEERATHLSCSSNRVDAVNTAQGPLSEDIVILAAGHGSAELAHNVGLKIPMVPAWGVSVTFEDADVELSVPMLVLNHGLAVTPSDKGLRVTGLLQIGGAKKTKAMERRLIELAKELFGDFGHSGIRVVAGPRPLMADSLPALGPDPNRHNLYHNYGHGHWGLTQASTSALIISNHVMGRKCDVDISAYRPDRFRYV
jgi:D-amino-acid dehydrogenase